MPRLLCSMSAVQQAPDGHPEQPKSRLPTGNRPGVADPDLQRDRLPGSQLNSAVKVACLISPGHLCLAHAAISQGMGLTSTATPGVTESDAHSAPSSNAASSMGTPPHSNLVRAEQPCKQSISVPASRSGGARNDHRQHGVAANDGQQQAEQSSGVHAPGSSHRRAACEAMVAGIGQCLQHAGLSWTDHVSVRAYFTSEQASKADHGLRVAQEADTSSGHASLSIHGKAQQPANTMSQPVGNASIFSAPGNALHPAGDDDISPNVCCPDAARPNGYGSHKPDLREISWEIMLSKGLARVGAEATSAAVEAAGLDASTSAAICLQVYASRPWTGSAALVGVQA